MHCIEWTVSKARMRGDHEVQEQNDRRREPGGRVAADGKR
jgi:hypothetical protein